METEDAGLVMMEAEAEKEMGTEEESEESRRNAEMHAEVALKNDMYVHRIQSHIEQSLAITDAALSDLNDESLLQEFKRWSLYLCGARGSTRHDTQLRIKSLFGATLDYSTLQRQFVAYSDRLKVLGELMKQRQIIDRTNGGFILEDRLISMCDILNASYYIAIQEARIELLSDESKSMTQCKDESLFRYFTPVNQDSFDAVHKLLFFYLKCANECGYVKRNDNEFLYTPHYTPEGYFSHTYEQKIKISVFIQQAVSPKEQFIEQWKWLTKTSAEKIAAYLMVCWDSELPFIERDRNLTAWRNGIYIMDRDHFLYYNDPNDMTMLAGYVSSNKCMRMVASKYHNQTFENKIMDQLIRRKRREFVREKRNDLLNDDWYYAIDTAPFQNMLDYQGFNDRVSIWMYVLCGRMWRRLNEIDKWQIAVILLGNGCTGKTTIMRYVKSLFDLEDIGIISNNVEPQFPLKNAMGKLMVMMLDIKGDFSFDQTLWNNMVEGCELQVTRKYEDPLTVEWDAPCMMACNENPNWPDKGESFSRRAPTFEFERIVQTVNTNLDKELDAILPQFVKKCNRGLHVYTKLYAHCSIWEAFSKSGAYYFLEKRENIKKRKNSLAAFLMEPDKFITSEHVGHIVYVKLDDFASLYDTYCTTTKQTHHKLDSVYYGPIFQRMGLVVTGREPRPENCEDPHSTVLSETWIEGIAPVHLFSDSIRHIAQNSAAAAFADHQNLFPPPPPPASYKNQRKRKTDHSLVVPVGTVTVVTPGGRTTQQSPPNPAAAQSSTPHRSSPKRRKITTGDAATTEEEEEIMEEDYEKGGSSIINQSDDD